MAREYFCAYHSLLESLTPFSDAECGRLFRACLKYSRDGEVAELSGNERFIWPMLKNMIDRDKETYSERCGTNRLNGEKGGRPKNPKNRTVISKTEKTQEKEKDKGEDKDKDKDKNIFRPPTLEDVRAYCLERGNTVDPVKFWSYYDAGDWKDAKGNPVRNWKQKLLTWENKTEDHRKSSADSLQGAYDMIERWANG
jgi:hypothetical protein